MERLQAEDRERLAAAGIGADEGERQLELLSRPDHSLRLRSACRPGAGIERIAAADEPRLLALHAEAAAAGRLSKFVPASGAASRMFRELLRFRSGEGRELAWSTVVRRAGRGDEDCAALRRFLGEIADFPFTPDLDRVLFRRGESLGDLVRLGAFQPILDAMFDERGLGLDRLPKGLLKFHRYPGGARTAFEEHLDEAEAQIADRGGTCRLHFTVSPEHRALFEAHLAELAPRSARHDVGWSEQKRSTDTLALRADGRPVRDDEGRLVLRPGGHGALIDNLFDVEGDIVLVKNIDNVQPETRRSNTTRFKRLLVGRLVEVQQKVFERLERLRRQDVDEPELREAAAFCRDTLGRDVSEDGPDSFQARRAELIGALHRPLRVCGVVQNTGEPGGGPFWVEDRSGKVSRQIVETAQIDRADSDQRAVLEGATHFNPVDLVCGVRDAAQKPFPLARFVDRDAVIVTVKSDGGTDLRALERPGLWNGAMAGWNTLFVEVPLETFSPVKTVLDLLRPEHRP